MNGPVRVVTVVRGDDPIRFGLAGEDPGRRVAGAVAVHIGVPQLGEALVHLTIAVVVDPVTDLRRGYVFMDTAAPKSPAPRFTHSASDAPSDGPVEVPGYRSAR